MEPIKVVARYVTGKMIKGFTHDFFPNKDRFHITPADRSSSVPIEVILSQLKAVFVVRDFDGNPQYVERKEYSKDEVPYGIPLEITFMDGEVMVGASMGFDVRRPGYFLVPADPGSNNQRVFVISSAVQRIRQMHLKSGMVMDVPIPGRRQ